MISPQIQTELDRNDDRARILRARADGYRTNNTVAEQCLWRSLDNTDWLFQVVLLNYIVDFLHPTELIAIEIEGQYRAHRLTREVNRDFKLYETFGICTIRFWSEEVIKDPVYVLERLEYFRQHPEPPSRPEGNSRSERQSELKVIRVRVSNFERAMLGKSRSEVRAAFMDLQPNDRLDVEVIQRIKKRVDYWPEDGYAAPGLQQITFLKRK